MGAITQIILVIIFSLFLTISFGFGLDLVSTFLPDIQADIGFDYNYLGVLTAFGKVGLIIGGVSVICLPAISGVVGLLSSLWF